MPNQVFTFYNTTRGHKKRSFSLVLLHVLGIALFIFFELAYIFFVGTKAGPWVFVVFYSLDIIDFLILGRVYLPIITRSINTYVLRFALSAIAIIIYALTIALTGDILEIIHSRSDHLEITIPDFLRSFNRSFYIFSLAAFYWYSNFSVQKERKAREQDAVKFRLEQKNTQLEHAYLRAQINPHLLHNVLATLYGRLNNKAPEESEAILFLSDMMRYAMQKPSEDGQVSLKEDIVNLQQLIRLYQFQSDNRLPVKLITDVTANAATTKVPPLLFVDIVQNIFKYARLGDDNTPAVANIDCDGKTLSFESSNAVQGHAGKGGATGLENIQRRLQKHYPGRHHISFGEEAGIFRISIKIELS